SNLTYFGWSAGARTVEQFAGYRSSAYTVTRGGGSDRLEGADVTPSLFAMLGETPALGRFFRGGGAAPGSPAGVGLRGRGRRGRFGAEPSIVGRSVQVDARPATIVGVAKPGLAFPNRDALVWMPLVIPPPAPNMVAGRPSGRMSVLFGLARLRPGATPAQAE